MHAAGLIHRDVKPTNLMVTEQGSIKLMDFGIARRRDELRTLRTDSDQRLGTPAYMAPEQITSEDPDAEVGPACDVYGLCATFYELFTRTRLFAHDRESPEMNEIHKRRGDRAERPTRLVAALPWEIETILLGGLEPGVSERYATAEALEIDLRHFIRNEPIEYRRPSAGRRLRLWYRREPAVARLLGAVAALLVAGLLGASLATAWIANARDNERKAKESAQGLNRELRTQKDTALVLNRDLRNELAKSYLEQGMSDWNAGRRTRAVLEIHKAYHTAEKDARPAQLRCASWPIAACSSIPSSVTRN